MRQLKIIIRKKKLYFKPDTRFHRSQTEEEKKNGIILMIVYPRQKILVVIGLKNNLLSAINHN